MILAELGFGWCHVWWGGIVGGPFNRGGFFSVNSSPMVGWSVTGDDGGGIHSSPKGIRFTVT